eukprot:642257-Pyramimonas_sp.AAC.1
MAPRWPQRALRRPKSPSNASNMSLPPPVILRPGYSPTPTPNPVLPRVTPKFRRVQLITLIRSERA